MYYVRLESTPDKTNLDSIRESAVINETEFPCAESVKFIESYLWVARDENKKVVGFATLRYLPDEHYGFLSRAAVLKEHRRKGIHTKLLNARIKYSKTQGWKGVVTYVYPTNCPSLNSLISSGFKFYNPAYRWAGKDFLYLMRQFNARVD